MGGKKRAEPEIDYKALAEMLAGRVVWAVKFLECKGAGMVWLEGENGHGKAIPWTEWFFDALDECGYVVDRDEYYKQKRKRR